VGAVGAACLLLSGCGIVAVGGQPEEKPKPVTFGKAAPSGKLALGAAGRKRVPVSQWPQGCELLKDEEITALLPQATKITKRPRSGLDLLTPSYSGRVPDAGCEYDFALTTSPTVIDTDSIFVSIGGIGAPGLVKRAYAKQLAGNSGGTGVTRLKAGSATCFHTGKKPSFGDIYCRHGRLLYSVSGSSLSDVPIPGVPTGSSDAVTTARATVWNRHVVIPAAATIAAKIA